MKSRCLRSFWDHYNALPESTRQLADKNFELWKKNPSHPSLRFKLIGDGVWSVRVGAHYRAVGILRGSEIAWTWIGHHSDYDKIL